MGILPSMRDEALSHCIISREIPCSLLKLETVLDTLMQLQKFPDIPVLTREEHPVSRNTSI